MSFVDRVESILLILACIGLIEVLILVGMLIWSFIRDDF